MILGALTQAHALVYYGFNSGSKASITGSDVILEQGTSGTSVVYMNATSAASQVDSHSTTFYPNDYNITHGLYVSGSTPSSVNLIDSEYFTVNSSSSHTSNLVYHPSSFTLFNATANDWGITNSTFTSNHAPSVGVAVSVEELAINLSTTATSNTATLTEATDTSQVVPFATRYVPTAGGTIDNHESTLIDISISGSTVTASRDEADSKQVTTSIYCVEFDSSINVYSGTFSIASGSATGTANIGSTISLSKGFLVFYYQASGTADDHPSNAVRGYFSSTTQITFSRATTTGSISGHWWVVEDTGSKFDVDAVDVTLTGASNTGTFGAVNMSRTMVVGSYSGGSTDDIIYGAVSMYLSSPTAVTVLRGGTTGTIVSTVYVIELHDGTSVQRGDISYTGAQTSLTDPLTPVTLGDSMAWIPSGWINTGHCTAGGTGSSDNLDVMIRVRLTSATVITGERSNDGGNDAVLHWEVVEWAVGGNNYQIDLEVQWTGVPDGYQGTEVAIKTGSYSGTEQLWIDFWNSSSQWQTLGYLASDSWNNFTIGPYLWSSDFTVRFKGDSETGDAVKDTWQIDASLIRLLGRIDSEDAVDNDTSDVDSSVDRGSLIDFTNMKSISLSYSTLSETQSSVSFEGSAESWSAVGASSHSFQYDLQSGAGHNRLVVVTVAWEDAEASASASVTFDGVAMAEVATVTVGTGYSGYAGMWYMNESLLPSTTGNKWISVTVSEAITREIYVTVAEYTGVAQEAPDDFATDTNPIAGNTAVTLTVADDGSIIAAAGVQCDINSWANTNNLTNIEDAILTSFGGALGHYMNALSGDIVVGWNNLGTREGMVGAVWSAADYSTDYRLDQEVQWTDLPYDLPNEEICIYTGSMGAEDLNVEVWNTTASDWDLLFSDLTASSWNNISITDYLTTDTLTIRFKGSNETGDSVQDQWEIDVALIHVWNSGTAEYSLDMEYQWTDVSFEFGEELCIYGGSMGTENILVDVWYNDMWNNVFADLSPGLNNISVTQYIDSSTFTIRVRDGTPTSDAVFDMWEIDFSLLNVWVPTYTAEVEFEGTSNLYEWPQVEWTVDSAWTNASIRVEIQLYNYSGGAYPASGNGFSNYTSGPAGIDETYSQVITDSPMGFRNATSGWKLKVRGEHTSQFDLNVDYIALNTTYYDEYTAQTEFVFTDVTDNQSPKLNFTVVTQNSIDGTTVTLQVWNYTSSSFPSSGMGYLSYISTGANNTRWVNVTNNAQSCLSGSYVRIRVTSVYFTTESYQQQTNFVRLLQEESQRLHDYALRITNTDADPYTVRLNHLGNADIDRLINCTIYLSSGGTQIQVLDGSVTQTQGGWVGLGGFSSLDILISASSIARDKDSVITAEVEALKTGTSTYTKLPVQLVIY